jgi:HlyD family secretion protein
MPRKIIPIVLAVLVASYFGYRFWADRQAEAKGRKYYGTAEATEVTISARITGRVLKVNVAEGQDVSTGDLLVELDDGSYRDQVDGAKAARETAGKQVDVVDASLKALEINLRRARNLVREDAAPRSQEEDLEAQQKVLLAQKGQAEAAVLQAEATVGFMERQLSYTRISSPVAGTVIRLQSEVGETAFPGSALLTIADLSRMEIRIYVPETVLGQIRLGQKVDLFADSDPDRALPARVAYISDVAEFTPKNVQTHDERIRLVYEVKLEAENPDGVLKIGMPVDARFVEE